MSKLAYILHIIILLLLQLFLFDNINLSSYLYINIYILAVMIAPDEMSSTVVMLMAFILGGIVDMANNTMGIHAASLTLLAYLRPVLLRSMSEHQENLIASLFKFSNYRWFYRYVVLSTLIFFVALMLLEAFSFRDLHITLLRAFFSSLVSILFILIYFFAAIHSKKNG